MDKTCSKKSRDTVPLNDTMNKFPVIKDLVLSDDFTPDPFLRLVQASRSQIL
jgi:hypothetical protein